MKKLLLALLLIIILPLTSYGEEVTGAVKHDSPDISKFAPVKIGGKSSIPTSVTAGDVADVLIEPQTGGLMVTISGANSASTATLLPDVATDTVSTPRANVLVSAFKYELNGTTWDRVRHSFFQNTTGITTNGVGTAVDMTTTPMSKYRLVAVRTAGATDVVEVDLNCSLDNSNYFQIGTITSVAGGSATVSVVNEPCRYMQYNVVTVGTGNTLTVQMLASAR